MEPDGRRYVFLSTWYVRAPREHCWAFLTAPGQRWLDWWPWLAAVDVRRSDGLVGSRAVCVWRSPVGYRLRTEVELVGVTPLERVELAVRGDVRGTATVTFTAHAPRPETGGGAEPATHIEITWAVAVTKPWMSATGPLLRPLFAWAHRVVMRGGERGLDATLRNGPLP